MSTRPPRTIGNIAPLLALSGLSVQFPGQLRPALAGMNLTLHAGERHALVGESGSGKSVAALAILRLLDAAKVGGEVRFAGRTLGDLPEREMRALRGADIAMVFQEPMTALNPLQSIGQQIAEAVMLHEGVTPRQAAERGLALLSRMGLADPARRYQSLPHQLSGGERQRAVIAMALACRPRLLIADEPTTALDMTLREQIVDLLRALQDDAELGRGLTILLITHDLRLVRRFAQRVTVLEQGVVVESGAVSEVFARPVHAYTRRLLDSRPTRVAALADQEAPVRLSAQGLRLAYRVRAARGGWRDWLPGATPRASFLALDGVDLTLRAGETLGVVGESGSGKSTLAMVLLGLLAPDAGQVSFAGRPLRAYHGAAVRALRAQLQVVFQDPYSSLSPRLTIEQIVGEGLALHRPELSAAERRERVQLGLREVGLDQQGVLARYPHAFSGGQRQRIAIARALALDPQVLILDEPTSALDVSVQKQVLDLLQTIQTRRGLSYVFITHDLDVVRAMAHRVMVMRRGRVEEIAATELLFKAPRSPYTRQLVSTVRGDK